MNIIHFKPPLSHFFFEYIPINNSTIYFFLEPTEVHYILYMEYLLQ